VGQDEGRERVRALLELGPPGLEVEQLGGAERQSHFAPEQRRLVPVGAPVGPIVSQDREAHDRPAVAIVDPVVVDVHPLGELGLRLCLDLDVDRDPRRATVEQVDLRQAIREAPPDPRVPRDLSELGVEELVAPCPVDRCLEVGREQGEHRPQEAADRLLPSLVDALARIGHARKLPATSDK
jgi:hypothetical protein